MKEAELQKVLTSQLIQVPPLKALAYHIYNKGIILEDGKKVLKPKCTNLGKVKTFLSEYLEGKRDEFRVNGDSLRAFSEYYGDLLACGWGDAEEGFPELQSLTYSYVPVSTPKKKTK